jgi:hypothetical protein
MTNGYNEIMAYIQSAKNVATILNYENMPDYCRAVAMIRTKLDEARMWAEEARRLEALEDDAG